MKGELVVGPRLRGDLFDTFRAGARGELIVGNLRGKWSEMAQRGLVGAVSTPLAGTTIAAGNVAPPAAAAATVLTLYNPPESGIELEILKVIVHHISGTPGAGAWAHCIAQCIGATKITAAQNATPVGSRALALMNAQGFTQTALTAGGAHSTYRAFAGTFAGALAASSPGQVIVEEVDGEIVVPAGFAYTPAPPAAGTSHVVGVTIVFAQDQ